ncbi:MAG: caspase family protein [Methylococcales bacterium]
MTQKVLLVGVNNYAVVGTNGSNLRNCVNNILDMANTLNALSVVHATHRVMHILTDARATKAAILDGFRWLIVGAKKGDTLVFFYSGHDSQIAGMSGDKVDKKNETIYPYDYVTAGMIKDDDFYALLEDLPTGVNPLWMRIPYPASSSMKEQSGQRMLLLYLD